MSNTIVFCPEKDKYQFFCNHCQQYNDQILQMQGTWNPNRGKKEPFTLISGFSGKYKDKMTGEECKCLMCQECYNQQNKNTVSYTSPGNYSPDYTYFVCNICYGIVQLRSHSNCSSDYHHHNYQSYGINDKIFQEIIKQLMKIEKIKKLLENKN